MIKNVIADVNPCLVELPSPVELTCQQVCEARKCLSSTSRIAQDHHGGWGTLPGSAQVARNYEVCFHQALRQHRPLQNSSAACAISAVLEEREDIHVPSVAKTHLRGTVLGASGICCNSLASRRYQGERKVPLAAEADGWVSKVQNHGDRLKL